MYISFDLAKVPSGCHPEWTPDSLSQCLGPNGNINIRSFLTYQQVDAADIATLPGEIPQIIAARLGVDALTPRNFDLSGMGPADDDIGRHAIPSVREAPVGGGSVHVVCNLDCDYFQSKLVEHFDILWSKNQIHWPKASAAPSMVVH